VTHISQDAANRLMLGACLRGPRVADVGRVHLDVDGEFVLARFRRILLYVEDGHAPAFESTIMFESVDGPTEGRVGFRRAKDEWSLTPIEARA
jgi:hypothetical protein